MLETNIKTCVNCMTYNHSQYITDTMKGFAMQDTDSPYICCIIDDASTDGEQDVILEFINRKPFPVLFLFVGFKNLKYPFL